MTTVSDSMAHCPLACLALYARFLFWNSVDAKANIAIALASEFESHGDCETSEQSPSPQLPSI